MIVGISGLAGSGKDTAADFMVKNHGFVRIGLADHIKRICRDVFDFTDDQLWGPSSMRNAPDKRYQRSRYNPDGFVTPEGLKELEEDGFIDEDGYVKQFLSPRYALQQLGTEWGRDCYQDVWIAGALRMAKHLLEQEPSDRLRYSPQHGLYKTLDPSKGAEIKGVVFSDIRFKNEMAAVQGADGWLWRMKRGDGLGGAAGAHPSEAEQLEVPDDDFNVVIENTDISLEELEKQVDKHVTAMHALETGAFA